jgi:hypothetical protein
MLYIFLTIILLVIFLAFAAAVAKLEKDAAKLEVRVWVLESLVRDLSNLLAERPHGLHERGGLPGIDFDS